MGQADTPNSIESFVANVEARLNATDQLLRQLEAGQLRLQFPAECVLPNLPNQSGPAQAMRTIVEIPIDIQLDLSNIREQDRACRRSLCYCRLMLAKNIVEFKGQKTAEAWRRKYGLDKSNDYFASRKNALWKVVCEEQDLDMKLRSLGMSTADKEIARELFCIWVATDAVRQIRGYHYLGLTDALEKGDESGAFLALMRFKRVREHPGTLDCQKRLSESALERNRNDFLLKLAKVRERPPLDFSDIPRDPIEAFLLVYWDTPGFDKKGNCIHPLCYFTDDGLASVIQLLFQQRNMRPDTIRKKCKRLGLLRVRKPFVVLARRPSNKSR